VSNTPSSSSHGKTAEARAASLSSPDLSVARHDAGGGTNWLVWLLVVALVLSAAAGGAYLWYRTRSRDISTEPNAT
jgi:hypothetical protein